MTANYHDLFSSLEFKNSFEFYALMGDAPNFGLWQLTVKEAAALVVTDNWFAGDISVDLPESDSYDPQDPELRQALTTHFSDFEKRLTAAIDGGSLKTTKIRRNLNEELDTDNTLVDQNDLRRWLSERGHEGGEAFEDYLDEEMHFHSSVIDEIYNLRMIRKCGISTGDISRAKRDLEQAGINELRLALKETTNEKMALYTKNMELEKKLQGKQENQQKKTERPLSTRTRRTLLTIIAALCIKAGINYEDRGAAQRISDFTEEIGAAVTDDTIRKIISNIDDALETRTK